MTSQLVDRGIRRMRKSLFEDGDGFMCVNCHQYVSAAWLLSGVRNRNHCPYCLYSRHLDLWRAGDRLAACKGSMQPVGLAYKLTSKRYGDTTGELMLVHFCTECGKLSLNRIAADDDGAFLMTLLDQPAPVDLGTAGIQPLTAADLGRVRAGLFGKN